ncbi:hypothetical protein [Nonomuraea sp. NPDC049709]|uniref:hypothetical protein n=1 Tax=Nonomuraea sp. NPDC049709 TaxID=3154736 RepID=UPI003420ED45
MGLGLAVELVRRGHRVTYATTEANAERVAETGAEIIPWTSTWDALDVDDVPQMHGKELIRAMGLLLEETRAALAQLGDGEPPDLVVHDGPLCWWGRILAECWRVPSVETWPNLVGNEHWSMHRKYTTFNPLSLGFLRMALRLRRLLPPAGLTGAALWDAVEQVAADEGVRERLGWMRGELAAAGGARAAADEVEKVLNWGS